MKTLQIIITTILLITVSFSCKKDDYPVNYTRYSFEEGNLRMFTKNGEVSDPTKIDDFIRSLQEFYSGNPQFGVPDFGDDILVYEDYDIRLEFLSDRVVRVFLTEDNTIGANVKRLKDITYLEIHDTIQVFNLVIDERMKYQVSFLNVQPIPGGNIYNYLLTKYFNEKTNELSFPIASYTEKKYWEGNLVEMKGVFGRNNAISNEYLSKMSQLSAARNDTIVFKESRIIFRKE